eukprot:238443_1
MATVSLTINNIEDNDQSSSRCSDCLYCCESFYNVLLILWRIISSCLSYTIVWSIISEILLLVNVYSQTDPTFFTISCIFLTVPIAMASCSLCVLSACPANNSQFPLMNSQNKCCCIQYIPFINIP